MPQKIKIILFILSSVHLLNAQTTAQWAKGVGSLWGDRVTQIVNDDLGNTYITGTFSDLIDMDPGPGVYNLTPSVVSTPDGYILKLDPNGNFLWAKSFGGNQYDGPGGIAVDANQH